MTDAARPSPSLRRLIAFAALACFASLHWVALLADPPIARGLVAAAAMIGGAAAMTLGAQRLRRRSAQLLAAASLLAAIATAAVALGLPPRLLAPANWGELVDGVGRGLSKTAEGGFPFEGTATWPRLAILLGLPLALGAAAALSFWPRAGDRSRGLAGLIALVATYGFAATLSPPASPLLTGLLLFALVALWLWPPTPSPRARAAMAGGLLVAVGLLALPLADRLDAADPWIDYREWNWSRGGDNAQTFDWDHGYGPIDWPRTGKTLFGVASDEAHYWRLAVLDRFDGRRWVSAPGGAPFDFPGEVETGSPGGSFEAPTESLEPDWTGRISFSIDSLESEFLVGAGAVAAVDGVDGAERTRAGVLLPAGEPLQQGDTYSVLAYTPNPSTTRMRNAPPTLPPSLRPYTEVELPDSGSGRSLYADIARLAREITAGSPTTLDAVDAVAGYLQSDAFSYSEDPPQRRYPLHAFLFRDRIGYCQQFSGAMALMLRMIGIPSRVAAGFSPGLPRDGGFVVRDLDAHSWVEVYFRGIGWVTFDPTPAAAPASLRLLRPGAPTAPPGAVVPPPAADAEGKPDRQAGGRAGGGGGGLGWPWLAVAALALAAMVAVGLVLASRLARRSALQPGALAEAQLRELERALGRLRRRPPPRTTLLALERSMRLGRRPAVAAYVARLRGVRYAASDPGPPSARERRSVRRDLTGGGGVWLRLRGLLAFPPGGPLA